VAQQRIRAVPSFFELDCFLHLAPRVHLSQHLADVVSAVVDLSRLTLILIAQLVPQFFILQKVFLVFVNEALRKRATIDVCK
jgi:hypothetical protein